MTFATMIGIIITISCLSVLRLPLDKWHLLCGSYSIRQGINSITVSVLKQPWLIKKGDYRGHTFIAMTTQVRCLFVSLMRS